MQLSTVSIPLEYCQPMSSSTYVAWAASSVMQYAAPYVEELIDNKKDIEWVAAQAFSEWSSEHHMAPTGGEGFMNLYYGPGQAPALTLLKLERDVTVVLKSMLTQSVEVISQRLADDIDEDPVTPELPEDSRRSYRIIRDVIRHAYEADPSEPCPVAPGTPEEAEALAECLVARYVLGVTDDDIELADDITELESFTPETMGRYMAGCRAFHRLGAMQTKEQQWDWHYERARLEAIQYVPPTHDDECECEVFMIRECLESGITALTTPYVASSGRPNLFQIDNLLEYFEQTHPKVYAEIKEYADKPTEELISEVIATV